VTEGRVLTEFQIEVAQLFFALPAGSGFLLAGGAGLLAQELTQRPTQDLDFFTRIAGEVVTAREAFEAAAGDRGWSVVRIHDSDTFCRLMITAPEALLVDLALDAPPQLPPTVTLLGPTFAPAELAARKLLALFDRAEARDFVDVFELARVFDKDAMTELAASLDLGFTPVLLAASIGMLDRFRDAEIPLGTGDLLALRAFFADWAAELSSQG